jgi:hypothetical protein
MIGDNYVYTGVLATHRPFQENRYHWSLRIEFIDAGWVDTDKAELGAVSTEGKLECRYAVDDDGLATKLRVLVEDAQRLGIEASNMLPHRKMPVYYTCLDGRGDNRPPGVDTVPQVLVDAAAAIGFVAVMN